MTVNVHTDRLNASLFSGIPDSARVWIFALDGSPADLQSVLGDTQSFAGSWMSHRRAVSAACTLLENRFLVVSGHIPGSDVSGCGVDALTNTVEEAARRAKCRIISPVRVLYRTKDGVICHVSRSEFRQLLQAEVVTGNTTVFNPGLSTVGELRAGHFEKPLAESCYARLFRIGQPAA